MKLQKHEIQLLKTLLIDQRVGVLGVLAKDVPVTGLLPFAITTAFDGILIYASSLARHAKNLHDGARFSFLIHLPDTAPEAAFQIPRVSLSGRVQIIPRKSESFMEACQVYGGKLPQASNLFGFKDFNFYRLKFESARLVAGFAAAHTLRPGEIANYLADK